MAVSAGVQTGTFDAVIAGQSMTAERSEQVDFAGPYYYATMVCVTKADSPNANASSIDELSGTATAQESTIWYNACLPQIKGADIQTAAESAPAMLMALETGTVDFVCTDMPTAQGAVRAYPDLKILDFSGTAFAVFFGFFFTCIVLLLINAVNGRCHIENALRQTHTLAGFLVQNLIEQLEHKIIGILRLQSLQFT